MMLATPVLFVVLILLCVYFSPSGWDNEKKISILYENMASMKPDDTYEDVIAKPVMRKVSLPNPIISIVPKNLSTE